VYYSTSGDKTGPQPSTSKGSASQTLEPYQYSPKLQELKGEKNIRKIVVLLKETINERKSMVDKVPYFELLDDFPYLKIPDMVSKRIELGHEHNINTAISL